MRPDVRTDGFQLAGPDCSRAVAPLPEVVVPDIELQLGERLEEISSRGAFQVAHCLRERRILRQLQQQVRMVEVRLTFQDVNPPPAGVGPQSICGRSRDVTLEGRLAPSW